MAQPFCKNFLVSNEFTLLSHSPLQHEQHWCETFWFFIHYIYVGFSRSNDINSSPCLKQNYARTVSLSSLYSSSRAFKWGITCPYWTTCICAYMYLDSENKEFPLKLLAVNEGSFCSVILPSICTVCSDHDYNTFLMRVLNCHTNHV